MLQLENLSLKDGSTMPRLGLGTWFLGEQFRYQSRELQAVKRGLEQGIRMIDTAEMYGDGGAETIVGKAIQDVDRTQLYLVSKVYPHNAGEGKIVKSCTETLERLGTKYLDLYLLHWRGGVPLQETVEGMEALVARGKIKRWGVSNFDLADMEALFSVKGGDKCSVNQVMYHLGSRGIEHSLLPWMKAHGVALMAYSPLAQGGALKKELVSHPVILSVCARNRINFHQLMLLFALRDPYTAAIPRTSNPVHVDDLIKGLYVKLSDEDWARLDEAFPPPVKKVPLDVI